METDMRGDNSGQLNVAEQIAENLRERNPKLVSRAAELVGMKDRAPAKIEDPDTADKISEAIRQINEFLKVSEGTRIDEKEPYLAGGRAVDGFFKNLNDPVQAVKNALLRLRTDWDLAIEAAERKRRLEEAERARRAAEEERKIAEAKRTEAAAERVAVADARAEQAHQDTKVSAADLTRTRTTSGVTTSLRKEWVHEVETAKDVPRKFCVPDDRLIRAAIKAATTADGDCPLVIKGVRIFQKSTSQVR